MLDKSVYIQIYYLGYQTVYVQFHYFVYLIRSNASADIKYKANILSYGFFTYRCMVTHTHIDCVKLNTPPFHVEFMCIYKDWTYI